MHVSSAGALPDGGAKEGRFWKGERAHCVETVLVANRDAQFMVNLHRDGNNDSPEACSHTQKVAFGTTQLQTAVTSDIQLLSPTYSPPQRLNEFWTSSSVSRYQEP